MKGRLINFAVGFFCGLLICLFCFFKLVTLHHEQEDAQSIETITAAETEKKYDIPMSPVETETTYCLERELTAEEERQLAEAMTETETEAETETTETGTETGTWSQYDIAIAAQIVQGEAGNQGYYGKQLVAQCLLQGCIDNGTTPEQTRNILKYAGWADEYDEETLNAVKSVFIYGERAVDDDIKYFYSPKYCNGSWHETQIFVLEYGGHKFFKERRY